MTRHACTSCGVGTFTRSPDIPWQQWRWGRGLCYRCGARHRRAGALDQFPMPPYVSREQAVRKYQEMTLLGYGRQEVAGKLGMSLAALERALQRARATPRTARKDAA